LSRPLPPIISDHPGARFRVEVGVHTTEEALRRSDTLEHLDEPSTLGGVQRRQQSLLLVHRHVPELLKQFVASSGQVQLVGAPVGGVAAALQEAALLEVVDEGHDGAAVEHERPAQCLLRLAFLRDDVAEHAEVPRVKAERGKALREAPMLVSAQLRQQERSALARALRQRGRRAVRVLPSCHPGPRSIMFKF